MLQKKGEVMPPVSRITDIGSGHDCFPSSRVIQGSKNVKAEGQKIARARVDGGLGDSIAPHSCVGTHSRNCISGSRTVYVNSRPSVRIGDSISCGGVLITGAMSVIFGG